MMRVLVTGAGGYIGSEVANDLARRGHHVTGIWRSDSRPHGVALKANVAAEHGDLADPQVVERIISRSRVDAIVHAAAAVRTASSHDGVRELIRDNLQAQLNLIGAALKAGCHRFLFCSTISVYGGAGAPSDGYRESDAAPTDSYGWSKLAGEQMLAVAAASDKCFTAMSLRLAGVHGRSRKDGVLHAIASAARQGQPIRLNEPESRFRWLFIDDLLCAIADLLAAPLPLGHHVCNLASADSYTLREVAQKIVRFSKSNSRIEMTGANTRHEIMNIDRAVALWRFSPTGLDAFLPGYLSGASVEA